MERRDEGMPIENRLDPATLDARAASVNQPDFPQTRRVGRVNVLLDDRRDVPRMERVEVERVVDGHAVRRLVGHTVGPGSIRGRGDVAGGFSYEAVTTVVIPPRTEKSPMTVILLGLHASARSSRMRFVTAS